MHKIILVVVFICFVSGCSTVHYDMPLPTQTLTAPVPDGKSQVVFFNNSNMVLYGADGSAGVGITIDGVGVASPWIHEYVQLYLDPGVHELGLSHRDIFVFRDTYEFEVNKPVVYVSVYNRPISTKYSIVDTLPLNFETDYRPVRKRVN